MNRLKALIAAIIVTGLVACGMLVVGISAAFNPNGAPVSDAPAAAQPVVDRAAGTTTSADAQAQIDQLQTLVKQYQGREKQYQDREQQYQSQLDQANTQVQQYQQVLEQLQSLGVIRITADGRILLRDRGGSDDGQGATVP